MSKPASRLGRGLNALIGPREPRPIHNQVQRAEAQQGEPSSLAQLVAISKIAPNPRQPRTTFDETALDELARSIRANGVLQPVLLRPRPDSGFELVAGERRWRAAKLAGLEAIPAIVRDLNDAETLEVALIENLQREDLGPIERAAAYQQYIEAFGVSVEQLAGRLAESRANIANYLRLLKLAPEIRTLIERDELGMGQARAIAGVVDPARQLAIARIAVRRNLSVRQVEALSRQASDDGQLERSTAIADTPAGAARHLADVERSLAMAIGLRVVLKPGKRKNSGRLIIHYSSLDEFDRLATKLGAAQALPE